MGLDKTSDSTGEGKSSYDANVIRNDDVEIRKGTNLNLGDILPAKDEFIYYSYIGNLGKVDRKLFIEKFKEAIIEQIKNKPPHAIGSEGEIYKIVLPDTKGREIELLVAKKRFDNSPDNEYSLQERIGALVQRGDAVQVPELRDTFEHEGYNYIVMDFIKGKTLYHMIVEAILKKQADLMVSNSKHKSEQERNIAASDAAVLKRMVDEADSDDKIVNVFLRYCHQNREKLDAMYHNSHKLNIKLFGSKDGKEKKEAIQNFITMMHKNGFYHRDLHEKNIIFSDDGKIYIIDFGKGIFKDPKLGKPSKSDIYEEQAGELIGRYCDDEDIVLMISGFTKTEDQEEWEKLSQQSIEKAKRLTSGEMIIESVDFTKIQSKKIHSRIKKYFGGIEGLKDEVLREEKCKYSINSFLGINDKDFILSLFSITRENLDCILNEEIPTMKMALIEDIKNRWCGKLQDGSWEHLFGDDIQKIDINLLKNVLEKIKERTDYEYIYKGRNIDYLIDIKPMQNKVTEIIKLEEIKGYLEKIYNATI